MAFSLARMPLEFRLGGVSLPTVAYRTWKRSERHELLTRAAAIAFYAIAALIPFLALVIALSPHWLPWVVRLAGGGDAAAVDPMEPLRGLMPSGAFAFVSNQLKELREHPPVGLLSFSLAATLWLSSSVFVAVIDAMNVIRSVHETRPFWKRRLIAMVMTLAQAAILIGSVATIVGWPLFCTAWLEPACGNSGHRHPRRFGFPASFLQLRPDALRRPERALNLEMCGTRQRAGNARRSRGELAFPLLHAVLGKLQRHLRLIGRDHFADDVDLAVQCRSFIRGGAEQGH